MRLLNTHTLEILEHTNPSQIPSYAILSHRWEGQEQTYGEHTGIISRNKRKRSEDERWEGISEKIQRFCKFAAELGYDWAWSDTCCINKESSAELSQSLNSMFEWYAKADVCIVYLNDVDSVDVMNHEHTTHHGKKHRSSMTGREMFKKSVWFTRGWTLQELIAPRTLLFVTKDWEVIGTRVSLAELISSITGIDSEFLFVPGVFSRASVGQRLAWAAKRQTTCIEDRAYSLMGLFGINMAVIYGEGDNAFRRLQEEILKTSPDQTHFAWGPFVSDQLNVGIDDEAGMKEQRWSPGLLAQNLSAFDSEDHRYSYTKPLPVPELNDAARAFIQAWDPNQRVPEGKYLADDVPSFSLSSYGIRARLPVIRQRSAPQAILLAILACRYKTSFVGMFLHPVYSRSTHPLYGVGLGSLKSFTEDEFCTIERVSATCIRPRIVCAGPKADTGWAFQLPFPPRQDLVAEWADIHISAVYGGSPVALPPVGDEMVLRYDIRVFPVVPRWVVGHLARLNFTFSAGRGQRISGKRARNAVDPPQEVATERIVRKVKPKPGAYRTTGTTDVVVDMRWKYAPRSGVRSTFAVRLRGVMRTRPSEIELPLLSHLRAGVSFDDAPNVELSFVKGWRSGIRTFKNLKYSRDSEKKRVRLTFVPAETIRSPTLAGDELLDAPNYALVIEVGGKGFGLPPLPHLEWEGKHDRKPLQDSGEDVDTFDDDEDASEDDNGSAAENDSDAKDDESTDDESERSM